MRDLFNSSGLIERWQAGELQTVAARPARSPAANRGFPAGTLSITEEWWEESTRVAVVHYYQLPDGSLAASGRPDPKWLFDGVTVFELEIAARPGSP